MSEVARCLDCETKLLPGEGLESLWTRHDGRYCLDCVHSPRIGIVGCGSSKIELDDDETVPAKDLYDSNYFNLKQQYCETCCDDWRILSAEHGLIHPEKEIGTYDASLSPRSESYIGDYEAGKWSVNTAGEFDFYDSVNAAYARYVILAGEDYVKHIEAKLQKQRYIEFPFRDDNLGGIGDQMGWLRSEIDNYHPPGQSDLNHYAIADGGRTENAGKEDS